MQSRGRQTVVAFACVWVLPWSIREWGAGPDSCAADVFAVGWGTFEVDCNARGMRKLVGAAARGV
jgi:hypothetical protein